MHYKYQVPVDYTFNIWWVCRQQTELDWCHLHGSM